MTAVTLIPASFAVVVVLVVVAFVVTIRDKRRQP